MFLECGVFQEIVYARCSQSVAYSKKLLTEVVPRTQSIQGN